MKAKFLVAIVTTILLAGCATGGMKELPDGTYLNMTTVGDTLDRSASVIGKYKIIGKDKDGNPIFEALDKSDMAVGPTVAGQAVVAVVGGVSTAATQGIFAVKAAKIAADACKDGKCGGNGTVVINDGSAMSYSGSSANAIADLKSNGALGCTTCAK